jgi:hypothetical protein
LNKTKGLLIDDLGDKNEYWFENETIWKFENEKSLKQYTSFKLFWKAEQLAACGQR